MTVPHHRIYAITLWQPWAWAVIFGGKDIENRSRPLDACELVIHAGKKFDADAVDFVLAQTGRKKLPDLATRGGFILGKVTMTGATFGAGRGRSKSPWAFRDMWNWHLVNPRRADPMIVCRGYPFLWHPPEGWERSFERRAVS